jgi:hypothetical protein
MNLADIVALKTSFLWRSEYVQTNSVTINTLGVVIVPIYVSLVTRCVNYL